MGRAGLLSRPAAASSTSASRRASARSAASTANGLSSRCLRARRAAAAGLAGGVDGQVVAAQALDREDLAGREQFGGLGERVAGQRVPGLVAQRSRGPQAGQQVGWAWKRRSAGSWYSAAHAGHMANGAMVVNGRS